MSDCKHDGSVCYGDPLTCGKCGAALGPTGPSIVHERVKLIRCSSHEEWLLERQKSIGSSDAAAVLGVSPFATPLSVYVAKTEPGSQIEETAAMRWGHKHEPSVAAEFAERSQLIVKTPEPFSLYRRADMEEVHATPDRLVKFIPSNLYDAVLEIKTTRYRADDWDDGVPLHVQVQVQEQLLVLGFSMAFVAVLIQGDDYREFSIEADKTFQEALAAKLRAFWLNHVQPRTPPAPSGSADYETVKRLFKRASRKTILLPADLTPTYDLYVASRDARLAVEKQEQASAAVLMAALGDADEATLPDGRRLTWKTEEANYKAQPARTITKRVLRLAKANKEESSGRRERIATANESQAQLSAGTAGADEVPVRDGVAEAHHGRPDDAGGADRVQQESEAP